VNCEGCGWPLVERRKGTKYHDSTCRARASERRSLDGTNPSGFWSGLGQVRRPKRSRQGAAPC
jgi:hypothetical protein